MDTLTYKDELGGIHQLVKRPNGTLVCADNWCYACRLWRRKSHKDLGLAMMQLTNVDIFNQKEEN